MRYILSLFFLFLFCAPQGANAYDSTEMSPNTNVRFSQQTMSLWSYVQNFLQTGKLNATGDLVVEVTDSISNRPISGALVMLGIEEGTPFDGNILSTNAAGKVAFNHENIRKNTFPITIKKDGYSSFTLMQSSSGTLTVSLQPIKGADDFYFVEGRVDGFPSGVSSTYAEAGFMIPAFRPESLMNFDIGQFISSYKVKIDVFGDREVPGNLVLPPQNKRYGLIPIYLNKPDFIMPIANGTNSHMLTMGGSISINDVVSAVKKKDFLSALNLMTFSRIGHTNSRMDIRRDTRFNLTLDKDIEQRSLAARLQNVEQGLDAISVSLYDPVGDRGDLLPMDIKGMKSEDFRSGAGKVKLGSLKRRRSNDDFYAFTGIFDRSSFEDKNATEKKIVGSLQKVSNQSMEAQFIGFLKMIDTESVSSNNRKYRFTSAENPRAGTKPNLILLNLISEKTISKVQGKVRNTLWSTIFLGDTKEINLPNMGENVLPNPTGDESFYWEVAAIYTKANLETFDLQEALRSIEHVSTVSKKF